MRRLAILAVMLWATVAEAEPTVFGSITTGLPGTLIRNISVRDEIAQQVFVQNDMDVIVLSPYFWDPFTRRAGFRLPSPNGYTPEAFPERAEGGYWVLVSTRTSFTVLEFQCQPNGGGARSCYLQR